MTNYIMFENSRQTTDITKATTVICASENGLDAFVKRRAKVTRFCWIGVVEDKPEFPIALMLDAVYPDGGDHWRQPARIKDRIG